MKRSRIGELGESRTTSVKIRGHTYSAYIGGDGPFALLSIGIGSHMQMTLSARAKKLFTVYSTDLYWTEAHRLSHPENLSMEDLVADVQSVVQQLQLERPLLVGFSCYGIIALEVAKKMGVQLRGVILVSTPPAWNDHTIALAQQYFDEHSSLARQENDRKRKEYFAKIKQPNESIVSVNAYEADAARYFADFEVSRETIDELWLGISADDRMMNHFFSTLLPNHSVARDVDRVRVPVILLAGRLDFDSAPLHLWTDFPKPPRFTIIDCGGTGHWPQIEEPEVFDAALESWVSEFVVSPARPQ